MINQPLIHIAQEALNRYSDYLTQELGPRPWRYVDLDELLMDEEQVIAIINVVGLPFLGVGGKRITFALTEELALKLDVLREENGQEEYAYVNMIPADRHFFSQPFWLSPDEEILIVERAWIPAWIPRNLSLLKKKLPDRVDEILAKISPQTANNMEFSWDELANRPDQWGYRGGPEGELIIIDYPFD